MSNAYELKSLVAEKDKAIAWIVRLEAGDVSTEERAAFQGWLNKAPEHRRVYEDLKIAWQRFDMLGRLRYDRDGFSVVDDWIAAKEPRRRRLTLKVTRRRLASLAAAASLVIVSATALSTFSGAGFYDRLRYSTDEWIASRGQSETHTQPAPDVKWLFSEREVGDALRAVVATVEVDPAREAVKYEATQRAAWPYPRCCRLRQDRPATYLAREHACLGWKTRY